MVLFLQLFASFLGFVFPVVFIKAINCQKDGTAQKKYVALSSACFGVLVFILIAFLNT